MSVSGPAAGGTPVTEIARFNVKPGTERDFVAAYQTVRREIADCSGCRSVRMTRGIESPSTFVLIVEWDTLEAHNEGFRGTERHRRWRAAITPYFADTPTMEHYAAVEGLTAVTSTA